MEIQIRTEINQLVSKLPESSLKPVLEYLKQVEKTTNTNLETAALLKKIFIEDAELLKKLAQ